ncbi:class I SAM-dependent methyltransferase [Thorsellia kenyensis]|uniref:Class I SAM-dependent methyltransferase n=1 Tax=Thorsellia kenyensis TaxID=1549888 RepID=A0ABV6CFN5_9GAMM
MISQTLKTKSTDVFLNALSCLNTGTLKLTLPNGKIYEFEGQNNGPHGQIEIHDFSVISHLALKGDIAFAEDYRDGKWDSPDIASLIECAILNYDALSRYISGSWLQRFLSQIYYLFKKNTKKGSRKNIHAHYDLGNEFYKLWLDKTMTYSSALYLNDTEDLSSAQNNKYDRILHRVADAGENVLEIGCGWGGFAERLASSTAKETSNLRLKGLTISPSQLAFAQHRLKPFEQRVDLVLEDYRDVKGKFDSIVSIEMFEAVGEEYWKTYFDRVKSLLTQKGKAVIQTITIDDPFFEDYRKSGDAIRSFIFPGGMLPSPSRFEQVANDSGLSVTDKFFFGQDYATTLLVWLKNFDEQKEIILSQGFDTPFIRLWRFYLAYCAGAFRAQRINVMQVELKPNS